MTRFITANDRALWAAIEPDSRCSEPMVSDMRMSAYLAPFKTEEDAVAALEAAGGAIDPIKELPKPGRQVSK